MHYEKFADGTVKCIEDEIPFAVPEGWAWCRLGNITITIQYGLNNSAKQIGTYRFLRITDIQNGKVNWNTVPFTNTDESDKYLLHLNDIVFVRTGATVGKSFLITELPYKTVFASYLIKIRLIEHLLPQYIYHFFNSLCYWEQITGKAVGVGQPNCNGTSLKELFIPIPPLREQKKIVPMTERALKYINIISEEKESLINLINDTKTKILNLAIQGKLIPQNPDDEPASILLDRIRTEKEALIKQGKIKRDKKESIIFKGDDNSHYEKYTDGEIKCIDEEIPFKVPNSWSFERLRNIFILNPKNFLDDETEVSFVPMNLICDGYKNEFTSEIKLWSKCRKGFTHFAEGDIAFAKISPCFENRKSLIFKTLQNGYGAGTTELYVLRTYTDEIIKDYVLAFLKSEYFIGIGKNTFSGVVGQQRIDKEIILDTLIPIPNKGEQLKICRTVYSIFQYLDVIESSLN